MLLLWERPLLVENTVCWLFIKKENINITQHEGCQSWWWLAAFFTFKHNQTCPERNEYVISLVYLSVQRLQFSYHIWFNCGENWNFKITPSFFMDYLQNSQQYTRPLGTSVPRVAKHLNMTFIASVRWRSKFAPHNAAMKFCKITNCLNIF